MTRRSPPGKPWSNFRTADFAWNSVSRLRRGNASSRVHRFIFKQPRHESSKPSLRANGSRECAPDDRLREAIHLAAKSISPQRKYGLLRQAVILRESGVSSTLRLLDSIIGVSEYWIARFRGR